MEINLFGPLCPILQACVFLCNLYSPHKVQGHWGFRFTVTPVFADDKYHELEVKAEQEYQHYLSFADQWSLARDHELVSFINSYCEKYHTTAHVSFL